MDEEELELLLGLLNEEDFSNTSELRSYIEESGVNSLYSGLKNPDDFGNEENLSQAFPSLATSPVKKKDQPEPPVAATATVEPSASVSGGVEDSSGPPSMSALQPTASDSPEKPAPDLGLAPEVQSTMSTSVEFSLIAPTLEAEAEPVFKEKPYFDQKTVWGNALKSMGGLGDLIDDMGRAVDQGSRQGGVVDDAFKVMTKGSKASDEDITTLMDAIQRMDELGTSDEFQRFEEIANKGGVFNFLKAVSTEPQALLEVFAQSMSSVANPGSLAAAVPIIAGGVTLGPGGVAVLPYAMAAAGAVLETALAFVQGLQEQLENRKLDFTEENIRTLVEDEEWLRRARVKAGLRGAIIGVVDGITSKVGITQGRKRLALGTKVNPTTSTQLGVVGRTSLTEGVGGAAGEAAASLAVGDDITVKGLGMEALAGLPGTVPTVAATFATKPKYTFNGQQVDRNYILDLLDTASPEELAQVEVEIKNDDVLKKEFDRGVLRGEIEETISPYATVEERRRLIDLEEIRTKLSSMRPTATVKARIKEIEEDIARVNQEVADGPRAATGDVSTNQTEGSQFEVEDSGEVGQFDESSTAGESKEDILKRHGLGENPEAPAKRTRVSSLGSGKSYTTLGSYINRAVRLTGFGKPGADGMVKGAISGMLRVVDGELVVVSHDGKQRYVLGALDGVERDSKGNTKEGNVSQDGEGNMIVDMDAADFFIAAGPASKRKAPATPAPEEVSEHRNQEKAEAGVSEESSTEAPEFEGEGEQTETPTFGDPEQTEIPDTLKRDQDSTATKDPEGSDAVTEEQRQRIIKKERIFVERTGSVGKVRDFFEKGRRRWLSHKKFLPKTVQKFTEGLEGRRKATERRVLRTTAEVDRIVRKIPVRDTEQQLELFSQAIRGEKNEGDVTLIPELAAKAIEMREHIDALSQEMIRQGLTSVEASAIIKGNLGTYLNRSYDLFDTKGFTPSDQVRAKAKNYFIKKLGSRKELIDSYIKKNPSDFVGLNALEAREKAVSLLAENKILAILRKDPSFIGKNSFGAYGIGETTTSSLLKRNENLAPEVRALMGERKDPLANYARTIMNLDMMVEKGMMLQAIKKIGTGIFLFEPGMQPPSMAGFNTPIKGNENATFDPLAGMQTSPEIAEALFLTGDSKSVSPVLRLYLKAVGTVKWANTVGNVVTHARNVIGNLGFVIANGHFNPWAMKKAFKLTFGQSTEALAKGMDRLVELNVVNQNVNREEIAFLFKEEDLEKSVIDRLNSRKHNIYHKVLNSPKGLVETLNDLYGGEDDFFKVNAFFNEAERYSLALYDTPFERLKDPEEIRKIEEMAAEIVKNTYPSYARVPELIKIISRSPLVGTFVAFQAESVRCSFNIMANAVREINSTNPAVRKIGAQRLTGVATYLAGKSSILSSSLAGGLGVLSRWSDDEDEQRLRKAISSFVPFWVLSADGIISESSTITSDIYVSESSGGFFKYTNIGASDPFSYLSRISNRLGAAIEGEGSISENVMIDALVGSLFEGIQPFVEKDMMATVILELHHNQTRNGTQIYNPERMRQGHADEYTKIIDHALRIVTPGTIRSRNKMYDKVVEGGGTDLMRYLLGFEEVEVNVLESFKYRLYDFRKRFKQARSAGYADDVEVLDFVVKDEEKGLRTANRRAEMEAVIASEMVEMWRDAIYLGTDPILLEALIIGSGDKAGMFSKKDWTALVVGDYGSVFNPADYLD